MLLVPVGRRRAARRLLAGRGGAAPGVRVFGVEPEAGDDRARSRRGGAIVSIPVPQDDRRRPANAGAGRADLADVRALADGIVTVSDDEIRAAMRFAFERLKLVVEPSGAVRARRAAVRRRSTCAARASA